MGATVRATTTRISQRHAGASGRLSTKALSMKMESP
ncbi:uncharacterized protein CCOS01_15822 [Colletotrichum costaricense]|uniref:Uncharacterized protein n=1 Tax=Colletotrichum costaricense TaxID=1209916 RepID=A0AAI9YGC8_9PEZI|nr:uncharacterized protein CCOS01_15822 [Colletotrichum costaricense]KAK1508161.1 hypothetical protein CCOS01_15822 [Colletotrichum costaricense]